MVNDMTGGKAGELCIGDVIFIHVGFLPFRKIAEDTNSWANHVGIVVGFNEGEAQVGESTFPFSRITSFSNFIKRSKDGLYEVRSLHVPLSREQEQLVATAAGRRYGVFYNTGFGMHSRRQFCSRLVHEVLKEALGVEVGEISTLGELLGKNPNADLRFWRIWYFGRIPWSRQTLTPASMLLSAKMQRVCGTASTALA